MDISQVYASADAMLWESQQKYEANIVSYITAKDMYNGAYMDYEKKYAEALVRNSSDGATIAREKAKLESIDEQKKMLQTELAVERFKSFMRAGEERINTLKTLLKIKTGEIR